MVDIFPLRVQVKYILFIHVYKYVGNRAWEERDSSISTLFLNLENYFSNYPKDRVKLFFFKCQ